MITIERLREVLDYAPDSGVFTWKKTMSSRSVAGSEAGSRTSHGYVSMKIGGARYYAHRLAWMYVSGSWPELLIDHIDGDRSNNSISNLRLATASMNQRNARLRNTNQSGEQGVSWAQKPGRWRVVVRDQGKVIHVGLFSVFEEAVAARDAAYKKFGYHANHGSQRNH